MKLAYWMYAGPAHIGTLRVASSFKNVHAIMHAPLGDDYFNVMRSMLERERDFTPVTASIVDRHVLARGSQEKVVENITRKDKEETPDLILLTPTCTSSILQEDLENFVERASILSKENAKTTFAPSLVAPQVSLRFADPLRGKEQQQLLAPLGQEVTTSDRQLLEARVKNGAKVTRAFLCDSKKAKTVGLGGTSLNITSYTNNSEHQAKATSNEASLSLGKANVSDVILADVNHYRVNELQAADRTLEQIVRFYLEKEKRNLAAVSSLSCFASPTVSFASPPVSYPLKGGYKQSKPSDAHSAKIPLPLEGHGIALGSPTCTLCKKEKRVEGLPLRGLERQLPALLKKTSTPSVNIIGTFTLGFHNQHDCRELKRLFSDLGITINLIIPEGGSVTDLKKLPNAWFNFVPYREVGLMTAMYLKNEFNMPYVATTPMGLIDTAQCIREIAQVLNEVSLGQGQHQEIINKYEHYIDVQTRFVSQAAWFTRSIDCQNLLGKKAVVFGDATHAAAMTKILSREMGIRVAFAGTYCKHDADWFREQVTGFCDQILITDDHTQVGEMIKKAEPAAIFGTQMERHVGKRLDIPCGVISAPVHIQNFPLGYRPFLGYEGTNQIADLVYNSFSLGMEDHLLQIFGGHDNKTTHPNLRPSDGGSSNNIALASAPTRLQSNVTPNGVQWSEEGLVELKKVPGFVRGKVQRNTEKYALDNNISLITIEVMYAAKEAVSKA